MAQTTLSQIQYLIQEYNEEIQRNFNRLQSFDLSFTFKIFPLSSQEDYLAFQSKLAKRKSACLASLHKIFKLQQYIGYLKTRLNEANNALGIAKKLVDVNVLSREIEAMQRFSDLLSRSHSKDLEDANNIDYYKSSFTDDKKIYELTAHLFSETDCEDFAQKIAVAIRQRSQLNDQIAKLNQANSIDILDFEEFAQ